MMRMTREFSHSAITTLPFNECLEFLRKQLVREGFQVVVEIPFHREFERHVGLRWKNYTVLVVWSSFLAYQGLLSDRDTGIFMPFNFVVADNGSSTLVVATNHLLFGRLAGTIGIQVLARDLTSKINRILCEIAEHEESADDLAEQTKEAS
jgi:uncharacterized protein (DUF302 family)